MRAPVQRKKVSVDQVKYYYALSVSFTHGGEIHLRLTQFVGEPRALTTTELGVWEGQYAGPVDASVWLQAAVNRWSQVLVEQAQRDSGQGELPLAE